MVQASRSARVLLGSMLTIESANPNGIRCCQSPDKPAAALVGPPKVECLLAVGRLVILVENPSIDLGTARISTRVCPAKSLS